MSDRPSLLRRLAAAWRAGRTAWRTAAADHEMRRQHQILQAVTEALPATVVVVDAQGRLCGALNSHDLMRAKVI